MLEGKGLIRMVDVFVYCVVVVNSVLIMVGFIEVFLSVIKKVGLWKVI